MERNYKKNKRPDLKRVDYSDYHRRREKSFRDYNASKKGIKSSTVKEHGKYYSIGRFSSAVAILPVLIYLVFKHQDFSMIVFCLTILNLLFFIYKGRPFNLVKMDNNLVEEYFEKLVYNYQTSIKNNEFHLAASNLKKALRIRESLDMLCDGIVISRAINNINDAFDYCKRALSHLKKEHDNIDVINNYKSFLFLCYAFLSDEIRKYEDSIHFSEEALKTKSVIHPVYLYSIGEVYLDKKDYKDRGEELCREAETNDDFPKDWNSRSLVEKYQSFRQILDDENKSVKHEKKINPLKASLSFDNKYSTTNIISFKKHPNKAFIKFSGFFTAAATILYLFKYDFLYNWTFYRSFEFCRDSIVFVLMMIFYIFYLLKFIFFPTNSYIIRRE